ncbi:MAG: flagellar biosynthesis anti-sigma factor FlgM [Myxococcaceae bacterium]|nr:flagellar biosynthesis anti-sigma factor FlgM [Myxococcaceae bacterium]
MKVNDQKAGQIVPLAAQRAASANEKTPASATEPKEKVSVSSSSDAVALRAAEGAAAAGRAQRVQEIISAVKNGQYYPSPQQIANQLVSEAEIEAKLRALLG